MGKQTIKRAPRDAENPYYMGRRATAQDRRLSYEARGVMAYLLSQPPDWELKVSDLELSGENGEPLCKRDKVYRVLDELAAAGYVTKPERVQNDKGQWTWTSWLVTEQPNQDLPDSVSPSPNPGLPNSGNPTSKRIETQKKKIKESDAGASGSKTAEDFRKGDAQNGILLLAAIKEHVWGDSISDGATERQRAIAQWLNGERARWRSDRFGFISKPALPKHVQSFAEDYDYDNRRDNVPLPRDPSKFVEAWRKWASAKATEDSKWSRS